MRFVVELEQDAPVTGVARGDVGPEGDRIGVRHHLLAGVVRLIGRDAAAEHALVGPVQIEDHVQAGVLGPVDRVVDGGGVRRAVLWRRRDPEVLIERDADGVRAPARHQLKVGQGDVVAAGLPLQRRAVDAVKQVGVAVGRADRVADDVIAAGSDMLCRGGATARRRGPRCCFPSGAAAWEER